MARKRYAAEEIIGNLREAEVALAQGQTIGAVARTLGISEPTCGVSKPYWPCVSRVRQRVFARRDGDVALWATVSGRAGNARPAATGSDPRAPDSAPAAGGVGTVRTSTAAPDARPPVLVRHGGADRANRRPGHALRPLRLPPHHGPAASGRLAREPQAGRTALAPGRPAGPRETAQAGPPLARGRLAGAAAGRTAPPRLVLRLRLRPHRRGAPGADPRHRGRGPRASA